jgi:hypothetical protein
MAANSTFLNPEATPVTSPLEPDAVIGIQVSADHRAILEDALKNTDGRAFIELLKSMPDVGLDSDFARSRG